MAVLFDVDYEPISEKAGIVSESFLPVVYDYRTDISCGVAAWVDDSEGIAHEPVTDSAEALNVTVLGDEDYLVGVTQLVSSMVEESARTTYEGLWV